MTRKCAFKFVENAPRRCAAWAVKGTEYCRHHPGEVERPKAGSTLLEEVVWDALKNSRCPLTHRYQGPGKTLPCRWCRTAHAVTLILIKIEAGQLKPLEAIAQFEKQLGWTIADPVVCSYLEHEEKGKTC